MKAKNLVAKALSPGNIYPHGLSPEEKAAADKELLAYRMEVWNNRTPEQILMGRLLQIKYQMQDVIDEVLYQEDKHFGYFLSAYIHILNKTQKEFAAEISVDETRLSRIIHQKEYPNDELFIRLELHTNNHIPALSWFLLAEKERIHYIRTCKELRKQEKKNVHNVIKVA